MEIVGTQPIRLITLGEVIRLTSRGRSNVYAGVRAGTFPKPVKDGTSSRWVESEVLVWNVPESPSATEPQHERSRQSYGCRTLGA